MEYQYPVLIIGQGIAGTLLSFELFQNNIPFKVIDNNSNNSASHLSGAALNPYSGKTEKGIKRRTEMYDAAMNSYTSIGNLLNSKIVNDFKLLIFDDPKESNKLLDSNFTPNFNYKEISKYDHVALVQNEILLKLWRRWLLKNDFLIEDSFQENELIINTEIIYRTEKYSKIIYCNGVAAMKQSLFSNIPFTKNRGDVLLLNIPELSEEYIYQIEKIRLLSKGNGIFWCGSNYIWEYEDMEPNKQWGAATLSILNRWLKLPFELKAHICAKRPTTAGQIPTIGWHPKNDLIGICNGLGTKGYSAGPLWIKDFVNNSILKEEDSMYQSFLNKHLKV
ncbi:MAG TPA: hypothetical protein VLZ83_07165 [Edaphocola sp.]|nr:hypothetical protein [Edaphocola sp.]